jgi:hypothetical protein
MKSNKRLFVFGCSFTNWVWPTWADIIAPHFDEYYNYGYSGRGNWYIYNMLLNAIKTHEITKDDTVVIQWSEWTRVDELIDGLWTTAILEEKYEMDALNRIFVYMQSTSIILKQLGCECYTMSLNDFNLPKSKPASIPMHNRILEIYQDIVKELTPSVINYLNVNRPAKLFNDVEIHDLHPLPSEHIELIKLKFPQYAPGAKVAAILDNQLAKILYDNQVSKFVSADDIRSINNNDIKWYRCKRNIEQGFFNVK